VFQCGKLARQAVSAISCLAEKHAQDAPWMSSVERGRARKIPATLAVNLLSLFERGMDEFPCPFGPGFRGSGDPCPLHHDFLKPEENGCRFAEKTTLAMFVRKPSQSGKS
jgi:hypothetical protein